MKELHFHLEQTASHLSHTCDELVKVSVIMVREEEDRGREEKGRGCKLTKAEIRKKIERREKNKNHGRGL